MRVTEHLEHDASDSAITRVVEHYERLKSCYEQSASCGAPTAGTEFSPLPMGPLSPETGGTTAAIGPPALDELIAADELIHPYQFDEA